MGFDDLATREDVQQLLDQHLARVRKLLEGGPREAMLSVKDVVGELQVARKTVERLIGAGELVASKVGTNWRIRRRDLDLYLEANSNRKAG